MAAGEPGTESGRTKLESSRRVPSPGGFSMTISVRESGMPQTVSKNSPSTNVLPSTSRPSATKKAVTTSRSATVRPTWSKRRTCAIGPSSRRRIDRASATVGVLSTSRCGTSANAHYRRQKRVISARVAMDSYAERPGVRRVMPGHRTAENTSAVRPEDRGLCSAPLSALLTARSAWCGRYDVRIKSFDASRQVWAAESFLDALGAGGADALVDRECLPQGCDGLAGVAFLQVAVADSLQGACFLWGRADVAGDGQRPAVLVAGLGCGRGAERELAAPAPRFALPQQAAAAPDPAQGWLVAGGGGRGV